MQTPREIFLELLKPDGKPERLLKQYEALQMCFSDPVNNYLRQGRLPGTLIVDLWGVTHLWPEGAAGSLPLHDHGRTVLTDITRWRDVVHAPNVWQDFDGWEKTREEVAAKANGERLITGYMGTGIFEQCHFLMGFEDTLTNLYEHPDEMHELIDYITDYRIEFARQIIDNLQPEALLTHDDWGAKESLFMSPDMWREFFKEPYRRFYGFIRDRGVIAIHHADSYCADIIEDMAEIGIQCWQGPLADNDIPAMQRKLNGRMILMGGIDAEIDREDATEEEIREFVLKRLDEYTPGGYYIPCITYGGPGTVYPHVSPVIDAAIDEYNKTFRAPQQESEPVSQEAKAPSPDTLVSQSAASEPEDDSVLSKIAEALYDGKKSRTVKLCEQAISEGIDPQTVIDKGLMPGMDELGRDFSEGNAFVPEMLMAAKAMNAATNYLKPLLVSGDSKNVGKVVLGTVKGDLHDIGKNLVKIMLEGSGFEVLDLGSDVDPSTFVQVAIEENCDLIACSALLTTCMAEMKNIVELCKEAGIRDKVKIMIGGAPITQSYCDEIGADAYSVDAGGCARIAAELLKK